MSRVFDACNTKFSPWFGEDIRALGLDGQEEKLVEVSTVTQLNEVILAC